MPSGTYIGEEEQFRGRRAHLVIEGSPSGQQIARAQFDEGKQWETHSRINFPAEDWAIEEPDFEDETQFDQRDCHCHERDSSFVCSYCYKFGYRGHLQQDELPETD